jgi:hypothetical protein
VVDQFYSFLDNRASPSLLRSLHKLARRSPLSQSDLPTKTSPPIVDRLSCYVWCASCCCPLAQPVFKGFFQSLGMAWRFLLSQVVESGPTPQRA